MEQDNIPEDEGTGAESQPARADGGPAAGPFRWLPRWPILALAATTLVLAAVLGGYLLTADRPTSGVGTASGTPQIGGPFELVNHEGRTVTQADFAGKYMLIYFGFTYCPDVCPTALQVMSGALDKLGDRAEKVQPVFISIDPERDTPENMAAYVNHFHERMVGLTGTPEQVREAARAYKVFYKKSRKSGGADYVMDHTSIVYLMSPDGKLAANFNHSTSPEEMAQGVARAMN